MRSLKDATSRREPIHRRGFARSLFVCGIFLTLASHVSSAAAFQDSRTLAWKFNSGDRFSVEFQQSDQIKTLIDTRERQLENRTVLGVEWEVTDVADDGNATIRQTINSIRIKSGAPGEESKKTIDIDSTKPDVRYRGISKEAMKLVEPLIGLQFEVILSPQNELVEFSIPAETETAMTAFATEAKLTRRFSPSSLKSIIANAAMKLPADSVKVGDSWEEPREVSFAGRLFDRTTTMTVSQANEDAVTAAIAVEFAESPQSNPALENSKSLTGPLQLLTHDSNGQLVFNPLSGIVSSIQLETEMKTRVMYRTDAVTTTIQSVQKLSVNRK